jgi:N-acetylneuraminic acid mutarotase
VLRRLALVALIAASAGHAQRPPLPAPTTNAATAGGVIAGVPWIVVALGLDSTKRWSGITRDAYALIGGERAWRRLPPVPGAVGRLAATSQIVRDRVVVIGGYTVDSSGKEVTLPNVDIHDPATNQWTAGAPTPMAVDDAISGVWRDSLIVVVSGWHDTNSVRTVQLYDVIRDGWTAATPFPGEPVFGHAGAVVGNTIVVLDGAARTSGRVRYALARQVWLGTLNPRDPTQIRWTKGPARPGPALYRAAAAACGESLIVVGGTSNPYNYNGIGYDRRPSEPLTTRWSFSVRTRRWRQLPPHPLGSMDHRGLVMHGDTAFTVGGMTTDQRVMATVAGAPIGVCNAPTRAAQRTVTTRP